MSQTTGLASLESESLKLIHALRLVKVPIIWLLKLLITHARSTIADVYALLGVQRFLVIIRGTVTPSVSNSRDTNIVAIELRPLCHSALKTATRHRKMESEFQMVRCF